MEPNTKNNYPDRIEQVYEFTVAAGKKPTRIDVYLAEALRHASRTKVQEAIDQGAVLVNGRAVKHSRKVQPGDHIRCTVLRPPPLELLPEEIPLDIAFEDEHLIVVNKPAGMVTHPGFGHRYGTLVNALLWHFGERESIAIHTPEEGDNEEGEDEEEATSSPFGENEGNIFAGDAVRPGIVHRLDKNTSGILVVAKNAVIHAGLASQFAQRTAKREYVALVWGRVADDEGTIEGNIGRSTRNRQVFTVVPPPQGKTAITDYTVEERFSFLTLLRLKLRTGRTHQIRVHCTHLKHPLFGDEPYGGHTVLYGGSSGRHLQLVRSLLDEMPRQALHAKTLGFRHPVTKEWLQFDSDLPQDLQNVLEKLRAAENIP